MSTFLVRRWAAGLLAAFLGLTSLGAVAAPASAATASYIATPNGMVGVQQTVVVYAPRQVNQVVTISGTQGTVGTTLQTVVGAQGYGSVFWTPTTAGTWTFTGAGNIAGATPTTIPVAAAPTETILEIPNTMQVNTTTNLLVVVNTNLGNLSPVGQVTVRNSGGGIVGSAYLTAGSGSEAAFATIPFTPSGTGVVSMTATFTPTTGDFTASTSAQAAVNVISTIPTVALRLPGQFNVGQTVWVTALITPSNEQGTVAIQVENQGALSGSIPLVNGQATVPWTPQISGNTNVRASFTNSTRTNSGVALQPIAVGNPLPADTITVAPTGQGAWIPGTTTTMTQGQNLLMTASAGSGSTVVLNESGPCVINGALLMAVSPGTCTITATSGGSSSFTQATATYNVSVTPPKKRKNRR